jgi:hypothetical protein
MTKFPQVYVCLTYLLRFPFIASEIFNCEINSLLDKFFDAPEKKKDEAQSDEEDEEEVSFNRIGEISRSIY